MSQKIGRNNPCPCGSGKKYKKCCIEKDIERKKMLQKESFPLGRLGLTRFREDLHDKPETLEKMSAQMNHLHPEGNFSEFLSGMWDNRKVAAMSTKKIIGKLKALDIDFQKKLFKRQIKGYISAIQAAEEYYYPQNLNVDGYDEDFIWLAICELWKRIAPKKFNIEMIDEAMQEGYRDIDRKNYKNGVDKWSKAWKMIKAIVPSEITNVIEADQFMPEPLTQSIFNWCQDFETKLYTVGLENKKYFVKRIQYCHEFCKWFTDTRGVMIPNMLQAEAESYAILGNIKKAEALYQALVNRFPKNIWGYIGWGDIYWDNELYKKIPMAYDKAENIYKMALQCCSDEKDVVYERLEELAEQRERQKELF